MPDLNHAINFFINNHQAKRLVEVEDFLNQYSPEVQQQFVSALYYGRTHLHQDQFSEDEHPAKYGVSNASHIPHNEYARLIFEKGLNIRIYLETFTKCAINSNFEVNSL